MITYPDRIAMIQAIPPGSEGVEVGTREGAFAQQIRQQTQVRHLHIIDAWDSRLCDPRDPACVDQGGMDSREQKVRGMFENDIAVTVYKGPSLEMPRSFPDGSLDWLYLDSSHHREHVYKELCEWSCKLKPGGLLMGHDYRDDDETRMMGFGVKQAVSDFCVTHNWRIEAVTEDEWPSFQLRQNL